MEKDSFRLQFGLRTMLLTLTLGGVAIGLLGKLYFSNPELCAVIVGTLTTILPFLLATGTLIRIGLRSKQRSMWVWGALLLVTPLVGTGLIFVMQMFARPHTGGRGLMSNKELIQRELAKDVTAYDVWNELEHRAEANQLSEQDVDQVVSTFVKYAKRKRPKGWDQPLHNQDDFLRTVRTNKLLSKDSLVDMCDAYYGPPRIQPYNAANGGRRIEIKYGTVWDNESHHGLGATLLWKVNEVLVDGEPLELQRQSQHSDDWDAYLKEPINKDAKELTAKLEVAYVESSKLIGLQTDKLPVNRWPKAIKRWKQTVKIPLDGTDPLKKALPPIKLATDPSKKPVVPSVDRLVVQLDANDMRTLVVRLGNPVKPPIPFSFDVFVVVGEDKLPVGTHYVVPSGNGMSYSGTELVSRGHVFDSDVQFADLIFEPNVEVLQKAILNSHGNGYDSIEEMWGKPMTLRQVQVERLDLEVDAAND